MSFGIASSAAAKRVSGVVLDMAPRSQRVEERAPSLMRAEDSAHMAMTVVKSARSLLHSARDTLLTNDD